MDKTSPHEVLLNYGKWIGATDFAKLIAERNNVSERQAKTFISKAYRKNIIKKFIFPDRTVIYGLTEFGPPASEVYPAIFEKAEVENVRKALEELRCELRFFKEPTIIDVSSRVGKPPEIVEPILYALAPETGWKPQEDAEREAKEAINLAGWLNWKQRGEQNSQLEKLSEEAINNASKDTKKRAEDILNNYADLVPKVNGTELRWPEETKKKWREIFHTEPPSPQYWGTGVGFVSHREAENIRRMSSIFYP